MSHKKKEVLEVEIISYCYRKAVPEEYLEAPAHGHIPIDVVHTGDGRYKREKQEPKIILEMREIRKPEHVFRADIRPQVAAQMNGKDLSEAIAVKICEHLKNLGEFTVIKLPNECRWIIESLDLSLVI